MTSPRILGIAGSASRPSKTRSLVAATAGAIAARHDGDVTLYDLNDLQPGLGTTLDPRQAPLPLADALAAIAAADLIVVGSPVYKGTYSGLFKHLFDLLDPKVLSDKPVVLTATGGSERHALVIEHGLRPLFAFFSADILPTALYATDADFADGLPQTSALLSRIERVAAESRSRLPARHLAHLVAANERHTATSLLSHFTEPDLCLPADNSFPFSPALLSC